MSSSSSRKSSKKFYVQYLGWRVSPGIWGREFTEPLVRELVKKRNNDLPKFTIDISKKEVKITQMADKKKIKYPFVESKDVSYATQALSPYDDVVACIFLGYIPETKRAVHVHVYRCDSADTAESLVNAFNSMCVEIPENDARIKRIEEDLVKKGQIMARASNNIKQRKAPTIASDDVSSVTSGRTHETFESNEEYKPVSQVSYQQEKLGNTQDIIDEELPYHQLAAELREKIGSKSKQPLVYPPKDYDLDDDDEEDEGTNIITSNGKRESSSYSEHSSSQDDVVLGDRSYDKTEGKVVPLYTNRARMVYSQGDLTAEQSKNYKRKEMTPNFRRASSPPLEKEGSNLPMNSRRYTPKALGLKNKVQKKKYPENDWSYDT